MNTANKSHICAFVAFVALSATIPATAISPVTGGTDIDYQPAILRTADSSLLVVFERLSPTTVFGDLWQTRSIDGGANWSTPIPIIATSANERHPALIQRNDGSYVLFYLKGNSATSSFRLRRATSSDGLLFTEQASALDLGWPTGGEINPHVVQHADGQLSMSYQRLGAGSGSYFTESSDGGATWDTLRTQIAADGLLPRIAFRESDSRYLATYQVNPGNTQLQLYAKSTTDPHDWSAARVTLASDGDNHDSLPAVMSDGAFVVFYIHANGAQYDIYSRRSVNAIDWQAVLPQVESVEASDVEPHPLVGTSPGVVQLYWGRENPLGSNDFDIYRQDGVVVEDAIFADGFGG